MGVTLLVITRRTLLSSSVGGEGWTGYLSHWWR